MRNTAVWVHKPICDIAFLSSDTKQISFLITWLDEKGLEKHGDPVFTA